MPAHHRGHWCQAPGTLGQAGNGQQWDSSLQGLWVLNANTGSKKPLDAFWKQRHWSYPAPRAGPEHLLPPARAWVQVTPPVGKNPGDKASAYLPCPKTLPVSPGPFLCTTSPEVPGKHNQSPWWVGRGLMGVGCC